jgi:serine/threonine protein phosphatase PrpC
MDASLTSELGAVYAAAIQGARSQQQDSVRLRWLADDAAWLIALADGMGGHAAGDLASKIAVDSFVGSFAALRAEHAGFEEAFGTALTEANARIAAMQQARPETRGMGTTLVAAHISRQGLRWISVGDSLLTLYRDGSSARLNEDHSLRGLTEEARGSSSANMLVSALSGGPIQKIDLHTEPLPIVRGDVLMVASDGVLSLADAEIARVLASATPAQVDVMTNSLIDCVERAGVPHQDNCTVALFAPDAGGRATGRSRLALLLYAVLGLAAAGAAIAASLKYFGVGLPG